MQWCWNNAMAIWNIDVKKAAYNRWAHLLSEWVSVSQCPGPLVRLQVHDACRSFKQYSSTSKRSANSSTEAILVEIWTRGCTGWDPFFFRERFRVGFVLAAVAIRFVCYRKKHCQSVELHHGCESFPLDGRDLVAMRWNLNIGCAFILYFNWRRNV